MFPTSQEWKAASFFQLQAPLPPVPSWARRVDQDGILAEMGSMVVPALAAVSASAVVPVETRVKIAWGGWNKKKEEKRRKEEKKEKEYDGEGDSFGSR